MTELPSLDQLIAAVAESAASDGALDQLGAATRARHELDDLTEALLDHFIEQARQAGCSWSQIGTALGVSKQAAQQRHTAPESMTRQALTRLSERWRSAGGLFTRFRPDARRSVVLAQEAARRLGHPSIGSDHVLLGLVLVDDGVGARALAGLGVTADATEAAIVAGRGPAGNPPGGHIPFTASAKKALEIALREALRLGHNSIGTEHILLALVRDARGPAASLLAGLGVEPDAVRAALMPLVESPT